jgi:hypothetical protein
MTLSVAFLSVAFWLCFFGWLSILETYQSIPWFVLLALLVIGFGVAGLTDNHRVWLPIVCGESNEGAHLVMLAASALVAIVLFATYFVSLLIVRHWSKINLKPLWLGLGCVLGLIVFLGVEVGVLRLFDTFGTSRRVAAKSTLPTRLTLDGALAAWLTRLYDSERGGVGEVPVYFVSSEGGGIRAAVWTALILEHFAEQERENFIERTFSISGVSGGAVGGAVFRACHLQQATTSRQCIERFAKTDMVSPLISAWMFEDVMARVLPTRWCSTPGCGLLSRGAWFEQAMENAASKLRGGLVATGTDARASRHAPYLLLNSTWIETGERAVASDLIVDWMSFPGAKDQLQILGSDIPLGTAAHNAARFPYTNPIGSLHAPRGNCPMPRKLVDDPGEAAAAADAIVLCGHLGDGGYFDNGGAQSTLDSVRGFAACLGDASDPDAKAYPRCQELSDEIKQWGRARLVPQVLAIRNDPKRGVDCSETCSCPALPGGQATADEYTPEAPECNNPTQALVGALGPGLAVLNVSGIGANGRLAEARQKGAVLALRGRLGNAAASSARPPVRALDLRENGVLYPLGWHLSPLAVEGLTAQAAGLQLAAENADPSAVATPAP